MRRVLFDLDGVLIDVSRSYGQAIRETVRFFSKKTVDPEEIQAYRNRGGLNNDWDMTEHILKEMGLTIGKKEIVSVFQELYLGTNFDGCIRNEEWMLELEKLKTLEGKNSLGIVTGRPGNEARYALRRFDAASFFPVVVTMEDIPEGKQKPHPHSLRLAVRQMAGEEVYYIGDTVDDMIAARRADAIPVGVIGPRGPEGNVRRLLLQHGAEFVLENINEITEVLS